MKFLYKINAGKDGFTPARIPVRTVGGRLRLGWRRYLDAVEVDDEVWIYFKGRTSFEDGVYVKGIVAEVDSDREVVWLSIQEYSTTEPLTDRATSARAGEIVSQWFRQVFFVPDEWKTVPRCTVGSSAESCVKHMCRECGTWRALPKVDRATLIRPWRMKKDIVAYVPAFWVIPRRSFIYLDGRAIDPGINHSSQLFYRFKVGDKRLTYPLALGIARQLKNAGHTKFDAIVPIPLSPDKAERRELHRTRALAEEVGRLMGAPVVDALSLTKPISKRRIRGGGAGPERFETAYSAALRVDRRLASYRRHLLVDDVCTEGSTLRCAADAVFEICAAPEVYAATAGQMIVRSVVADDDAFFVS